MGRGEWRREKRGLLQDNSALLHYYGRNPPLHSFAISLSGPSGTVRLGSFRFLLFFLSSSSSSRMRARGSQGNIPEGWEGVHDRVYTSSIFNMVGVHSLQPRREEANQLESAQNTVRVRISPLRDKTHPTAQSAARTSNKQTNKRNK